MKPKISMIFMTCRKPLLEKGLHCRAGAVRCPKIGPFTDTETKKLTPLSYGAPADVEYFLPQSWDLETKRKPPEMGREGHATEVALASGAGELQSR